MKPAVIFRLCSNRSVPALLIPDFCTACFLGGECSILLSYVDMPIFWLKHWVFRQSAVAAVFMISDGFRRPETTDENFWFRLFFRRRSFYPAELQKHAKSIIPSLYRSRKYHKVLSCSFPARRLPSIRPSVCAMLMLWPGRDVVYWNPNRQPEQLPVAYSPRIGSNSWSSTC